MRAAEGPTRNRWCRSAQPPANILNPYRDSRTARPTTNVLSTMTANILNPYRDSPTDHVVERDHPVYNILKKQTLDFCFLGEQID